MIDVHVCHMPGEVCTIFDNGVLASIDDITIYEHESVPGDIMRTRIEAFRTGHSDYVSFVDPDDEVLEDGFNPCLDILDRNRHSFVFTNSYREGEANTSTPMYDRQAQWRIDWHMKTMVPAHQIVVMRRDMLEIALREIERQTELLAHTKYQELQVIYAHLVRQAPAFLLSNIFPYRWNAVSGNQARKKALDTDEKFIVEYIKKVLYGIRYKPEAPYDHPNPTALHRYKK